MTYEEYLAHHGILGMKWGKRNGPPYPLNSDQMTAMERAKNDVSEYAAKAYAARKKAKIREKEQVRQNKVKEKEQIRQSKVREKEERRQTKVQEKEERRQNKVDEKESARMNRKDEKEISRQNRFEEKEIDKQNEFDKQENWEQYKRGRTYVKKFLIGAGVMTVAGLAAYKMIKTGQANKAIALDKSVADSAKKTIQEVAKKTTGTKPNITAPTSSVMKGVSGYINSATSKGVLGNKAKASSTLFKGTGVQPVTFSNPTNEMQKAMNFIAQATKDRKLGNKVLKDFVKHGLVNDDDYLEHSGILGMKWGVRNGPPYPLTRRSMSASERKENPTSNGSSDSKEGSKKVKPESGIKIDTPAGEKTVPNAKKVKDMSDEELNAAIKRMDNEKKMRVANLNDPTKGKAWVNAFLLTAGAMTAATVATGIGKKIGDTINKEGTDKAVDKVVDKVKEFIAQIKYSKRLQKEGVW